jgi:hypothetical protein
MTLYTSFKNAHWNVLIAVLGTLCLNVIIILSTGLLTVQTQTINDTNAAFTLSSTFNERSQVRNPTEGLSTAHGLRHGLPFPNGTTPTFAYQLLDSADFPSGINGKITVDAFYPHASCRIVTGEWVFGHVQYAGNMSRLYPGVRRTLRWPGCEKTSAWGFKLDPGLVQTAAGVETYSLSVVPNPCEGILAANTTWEQFGVVASSMTLSGTNITLNEARKRYVQWTLTNSTKRIGKDVNGDGSMYFAPSALTMLSSKIAGVVCTMTPQLGKSELVVSKNTIQAAAMTESRRELNRTLGWQLQRALYTAFANDAEYLAGYNSTPYVGEDFSLEKYSAQYAPLFQLLNDTNIRKKVDQFVDTGFLMKSVPSVLDRVAVQIAATDYFASSKQKVIGVINTEVGRLVVMPVAMGIIVGLLALMTVISIALCVWSEGVIACNPATIAGTAKILSNRSDIVSSIEDIHCIETTDGDCTSDRNGLLVTISPAPVAYRHKNETGTVTAMDCTVPAKIVWWNPWSTLPTVSFLVLLFPCTGIAILEALLRLSVESNGIAAASSNHYVQYGWMYIPVLAIFALNSLFDAIGSTNRTLQPFITMRERPNHAVRTVRVDLVNKTTFSALYHSMKSRHLGVIAALAATLLGWTLPVAASGLFAVHNVQKTNIISLREVNRFDPLVSMIPAARAQGNFLPLPGLILYNNLSSPRWTYGKYAFPELEIHHPSLNAARYETQNATIRLELPAIYGVANCTFHNVTGWNVDLSGNRTNVAPNGRIFPLITLESKTPEGCPPLPCDLMPSADNVLMANWRSIADVRGFHNSTLPKGKQPWYNSSAANYHGTYRLLPQCPLSVMCTASGVTKAKYLNDSEVEEDTPATLLASKVMHCSPYVEQETVRLDLSLPDFDILPSNPPIPIAGTRKFFSEAELINTADFSWYLPLQPFVKVGDHFTNFDHFFGAVASGEAGVDPVAIAGDDTKGTKALLDRIDEVYGIIVAQVYNEKRRFAALPNDSTSMLNGTLIATTTARILQDEISTRFIQAILAAMILCALGTILFTDGRRILPDRPCSIATMGGLLIRSSLLGEKSHLLDEDLKSDDDLHETSERYSLGWRGELRSRWYGIDVGKADVFE